MPATELNEILDDALVAVAGTVLAASVVMVWVKLVVVMLAAVWSGTIFMVGAILVITGAVVVLTGTALAVCALVI